MKDFAEFVSLVQSADGQEAVYRGAAEIMGRRTVDFNDPDSAADFFMTLHRCSVESALNLLRLYHDWAFETDSH